MADKTQRYDNLFKALAEKTAEKYKGDALPPTYPPQAAGFIPEVRQGRHSVTLSNTGSHLGISVPFVQEGLVIGIESSMDDGKPVLRCKVTDAAGEPRSDIPVTLSQGEPGREDLLIVEKRTDGDGYVDFIVIDEDLPWTSITVGTVDGVNTIHDLRQRVA